MKIVNQVFSGLLTLAVILLIFLAYGSMNNRFYRIVTVEGNSMSPTLWYGDLILVTPPVQDTPVNSIVLLNVNGSLVTHRLLGFDANNQPLTKGDANQVPDNFTNQSVKIVGIERLRLPGLGYPLLWIAELGSKI